MRTSSIQKIRWAACLAAGAMVLIPAPARGQGQPAAPPPQAAAPAEQTSGAMIKKESKLVLVDSVVTDKKGNYVRDLTQKDFKVFEDNKEQQVSTFSTGADVAIQANGQRRYLILFFDNSTMGPPEQIQARGAAAKFIAANSSNRPEFHGQPGRTPCGGIGSERFFGRSKRAFTNHIHHGGVYWPAFVWLFSGKRRGGFWGPQHVARGTQFGEKSPHCPRP